MLSSRNVSEGSANPSPAPAGTSAISNAIRLSRADGHGLVVYPAEPGTPDHDAMVLLDTADLTAAVSS